MENWWLHFQLTLFNLKKIDFLKSMGMKWASIWLPINPPPLTVHHFFSTDKVNSNPKISVQQDWICINFSLDFPSIWSDPSRRSKGISRFSSGDDFTRLRFYRFCYCFQHFAVYSIHRTLASINYDYDYDCEYNCD